MYMRVFVEVIDAVCVEKRSTPFDTVNFVSLAQQKLGQIGSVLPGNSRDQCFLLQGPTRQLISIQTLFRAATACGKMRSIQILQDPFLQKIPEAHTNLTVAMPRTCLPSDLSPISSGSDILYRHNAIAFGSIPRSKNNLICSENIIESQLDGMGQNLYPVDARKEVRDQGLIWRKRIQQLLGLLLTSKGETSTFAVLKNALRTRQAQTIIAMRSKLSRGEDNPDEVAPAPCYPGGTLWPRCRRDRGCSAARCAPAARTPVWVLAST